MRRTKIIATLGPATASAEMISKLIDAGIDIARINMAHSTHDSARQTVSYIREAAKARSRAVGILLDTQGPAIRTGDLPGSLDLKPGQKFTFTVQGERSEEVHSVDVNYENFINDIRVGDVVLIDNGTIRMKVLGKQGNRIQCEVLTPGTLRSRRHINLPGVHVSLPALTSKDVADINLGLDLEVDFIALSFVRQVKDLEELHSLCASSRHRPLIIAKIEGVEAITNLDEIIQAADGIMVARGDLGIELPYEELPIIQRRIVKTCLKVGRPVIVATHMLESMIESPMPTRAEVTDVANAVYEQADAIMLSGETSVGKYPLQCMEVLNRIAIRTERSGGAGFQEFAELSEPREKLTKSAVVMANELKADAMLVFTRRGNMARYTAWMRPRYSPVFAFCDSFRIANALSLHWGVIPEVIQFDHENPDKTIIDALAHLLAQGKVHTGSTIVIVSCIRAADKEVDAVQMRKV